MSHLRTWNILDLITFKLIDRKTYYRAVNFYSHFTYSLLLFGSCGLADSVYVVANEYQIIICQRLNISRLQFLAWFELTYLVSHMHIFELLSFGRIIDSVPLHCLLIACRLVIICTSVYRAGKLTIFCTPSLSDI